MGFEPTTFGTTIRHSNQLSYIHHLDLVAQIGCKCNTLFVSVQIYSSFFDFLLQNKTLRAKGCFIDEDTLKTLKSKKEVLRNIENHCIYWSSTENGNYAWAVTF